jgi:hypothetical protein
MARADSGAEIATRIPNGIANTRSSTGFALEAGVRLRDQRTPPIST